MLLKLLSRVEMHDLGTWLSIQDCYVLARTTKKTQDFFLAWMHQKLDKALQGRLRRYLGDTLPHFLSALRQDKAVLAGGFVLQTLLGETWRGSDIDIFVGVGEEEESYFYKNFTHIEEFLFYYCRRFDIFDTIRRTGGYDNDHDILGVRNYEMDRTSGGCIQEEGLIHEIYEALSASDIARVQDCYQQLKDLTSKSFADTTDYHSKYLARLDTTLLSSTILTPDIHFAVARLIDFHYRRILEEFFFPATHKLFQVVHKRCSPETLIDNLQKYFDFDVCKVIVQVNEEGTFELLDSAILPAVFKKKCRFVVSFRKGKEKDKGLPSALKRYFKYRSRGFEITDIDPHDVFLRLAHLWKIDAPIFPSEFIPTLEVTIEILQKMHEYIVGWDRYDERIACDVLIQDLQQYRTSPKSS